MKPKKSENQNQRRCINELDEEIFCIVFSFLDLFDLIRSSAVCKLWNTIIGESKLLHALYLKKWGNSASSSAIDMGRPLSVFLEDMALQHNRSILVEGSAAIDQWKGHATGVSQCRMKSGLILTGVGDKVMRLWSSENYQCLKEYSLSDLPHLVDFDFDESKVVGLIGPRLCIWRRQGTRSICPSSAYTSTKGMCMRYMDPEAFVGCCDGTVRVFDMYSNSCSRIIRMHDSQARCLAVGECQLILSGSATGSITVSSLSSDQRVATLKPSNHRAISTMCYNPSSHMVLAGSSDGTASCWDLRTMQSLWSRRISMEQIYSMEFLRNDTYTLIVGGGDGAMNILDQNTGEILTRCVMDRSKGKITSRSSMYGSIERKKVKRLTVANNGHPILHPIAGNVNPIAGNMNPIVGNVNPIAGNMNPIVGNVNPIAGNMNPIVGNVNPIAGNMNPFGGNVNPFGGNVNQILNLINGNLIAGNVNPGAPFQIRVPRSIQPIKSLAVGMGKVVTTHNNGYIRLWRFHNFK